MDAIDLEAKFGPAIIANVAESELLGRYTYQQVIHAELIY